MRRRTSWLLAFVSLVVLAWQGPALRAGQPPEDKEKEDAKKIRGPRAEDRRDHRVHHRRSDVDVGRRLARRPHDRLRSARRPLHAADRRRRRPRASSAACRSRASRHGRPTARRSRSSPIAPASRTCGSPNADGVEPARGQQGHEDQRPAADHGLAGMDARRPVHRRARSRGRPIPGTFWLFMYHRDGGTGVRVGAPPPPQPAPDATGPPPPPPPNRMGAVVSPDGRFIYYAQRTGDVHLQRALPAVADPPPRSRDRRRHRR